MSFVSQEKNGFIYFVNSEFLNLAYFKFSKVTLIFGNQRVGIHDFDGMHPFLQYQYT